MPSLGKDVLGSQTLGHRAHREPWTGVGPGFTAVEREGQQAMTRSAISLVHARGSGHAGPAERAGGARWLHLALVLEVAAAVRFYFVLQGDFPLNDGGLFLRMVQAIQEGGFALPVHVSYNGWAIPFAYPPLAFYVAAWLATVLQVDPLTVLRWLPPVVSVLTLVPFYYLVQAALPTPRQRLLAAMAFAFVPRAYNWEIMGGGLTRSLGFFFALWTIGAALRLVREGRRRDGVGCLLFGALTLLSHLEMALFAALSAALIRVCHGRVGSRWRPIVGVGLGVLALTAPWWGTVIARHGVAPFLAAAASGQHTPLALLKLLAFDFADEPLAGLFGVLGTLGLLVLWADGRPWIPLWVLLLFVADPRKASTTAMVPMAMAFAYLVDQLLWPRLARAHRRWPAIVLGVLLAHATLATLYLAHAPNTPLRALSPAEREAMAWVRAHTPPQSRFVVVSGAPGWPQDALAEWFPVLAGRTSVATVQGTEWLADGQFDLLVDRYEALQACVHQEVRCLESWAAQAGISFDHVYVGKRTTALNASLTWDCCSGLRVSLRSDPAYQVLQDGPGGLIVRRLRRPGTPTASH